MPHRGTCFGILGSVALNADFVAAESLQKLSGPLLIAAMGIIGLIANPLLQPTWVMVH